MPAPLYRNSVRFIKNIARKPSLKGAWRNCESANRIDCVPCFDDVVISLSLAAAVVIDLKQKEKQVPILLEPRSLLVLRGEARYHWMYGIAKRQQDNMNSTSFPCERRLSITFRNVIITA